jgi:hypothetical protein
MLRSDALDVWSMWERHAPVLGQLPRGTGDGADHADLAGGEALQEEVESKIVAEEGHLTEEQPVDEADFADDWLSAVFVRLAARGSFGDGGGDRQISRVIDWHGPPLSLSFSPSPFPSSHTRP